MLLLSVKCTCSHQVEKTGYDQEGRMGSVRGFKKSLFLILIPLNYSYVYTMSEVWIILLLVTFVNRPGVPLRILKRTELDSSGQRLISSIGKTKRIAFSKHRPFGPMLSISRFVRLSVCLSVRVFTFEVPFNGLFAPTSQSRMSNIFRDSESLGKSNGKKWSHIW